MLRHAGCAATGFRRDRSSSSRRWLASPLRTSRRLLVALRPTCRTRHAHEFCNSPAQASGSRASTRTEFLEQVLHTKLHLSRNRVAGARDAAEPGAPEIEVGQPKARRIGHVVHLGTELQLASACPYQKLHPHRVEPL